MLPVREGASVEGTGEASGTGGRALQEGGQGFPAWDKRVTVSRGETERCGQGPGLPRPDRQLPEGRDGVWGQCLHSSKQHITLAAWVDKYCRLAGTLGGALPHPTGLVQLAVPQPCRWM